MRKYTQKPLLGATVLLFCKFLSLNFLKDIAMEKQYYLVATPESLIASHLNPYEFGNYMAVGTKKNLRSQCIFFEVNPAKTGLPVDYVNKNLVPYENGEPKRSVYLSIYRVFEKIPMDALLKLYLVTDDGKVLEIAKTEYAPTEKKEIHLYQQYNPFSTMVASKLTPPEFIHFLTDTQKPVSVPRLFFVELQLNELANNPSLPIKNLPYKNPAHLRECLLKLQQSSERLTKTVMRIRHTELPYRTIETGFFIGDQKSYFYFPFPNQHELETTHFSWWRSALVQHF